MPKCLPIQFILYTRLPGAETVPGSQAKSVWVECLVRGVSRTAAPKVALHTAATPPPSCGGGVAPDPRHLTPLQVFQLDLALANERGLKRAALAAWVRARRLRLRQTKLTERAHDHRDSRLAWATLRGWHACAARRAYVSRLAARAADKRHGRLRLATLQHWRWYCCGRRLLLRVFQYSNDAWERLWESGTMMYGAEYRLLLRAVERFQQNAIDCREARRMAAAEDAADALHAWTLKSRTLGGFVRTIKERKYRIAFNHICRRAIVRWRVIVEMRRANRRLNGPIRRHLRSQVGTWCWFWSTLRDVALLWFRLG